MPKMTLQEARELGLLSPEELAALGHNPFTPRAGASWTPNLGVRPGLNSSSFFRYPGLYQRPGISSLRFGLGGLGQGLTLSPESPGLGLAGISGPVGRSAASGQVGRGVAGGIAGGIAGGVAGGRAAIGSEGSGNLPTMILPDGRRLVRLPDGRTFIVGGPRGPVSAEAPEGMAALQAMGMISQGVSAVKQLADLISKIPGGTPGGMPGGVPGGVPGGEPGGVAEDGPGAGLVRPASLQQGPATPADALLPPDLSPEDLASLGELGMNTDLLRPAAAAPGGPLAPVAPPDMAQFGPGTTFEMPGGSSPFGPGSTTQGPGPEFWRSLESAPSAPSPGAIGGPMPTGGEVVPDIVAPPGAEMMPGGGTFQGADLPDPLGDLRLSQAFYAPGGTGFNALDPETRRLYELGLTPEQIMGMMPAPAAGRADTAPRGLGPDQADIFGGGEPGAEGGVNFTLGNTLGLGQTALGIGQGIVSGGLTGDPAQLISALIKSGMSVNSIAKIPGINQAGISAGLGGALGILNLVQAARSGNMPGAIGGGLSTIGSAAQFAASSPALQSALGIGSKAFGATGAIAGGAGGLLSLAQGIQGLIKGGASPVQSALQMAGGLTSTYSAIVQLSQMYPTLFNTVLPSVSQIAGSGLTSIGLPGVTSALGLVSPAAATAAANVAAMATPAVSAALGITPGVAGTAGSAGSALAPAAGAVAGVLAAAAPIIAFVVSFIGAEEEKAARNAGWANNPIKGALYSQATENVANANKILDSIQKTGDLSAVSTADIGKLLPQAVNSMQSYYATAQGPKGAVKASDTITGAGGLTSAKAYMGGQTPAEYTKNAENAKAGIAGIVKELMNRGVTYEQIGQLPVSGDWASQTLDAGNTPQEMFERTYSKPAPGQTESRWAEGQRLGNVLLRPGWAPADQFGGASELLTESLGTAMTAPDAIGKASGNMTSMYGGPFWAAVARMGIPELMPLVNEHFDPWVSSRTWNPAERQAHYALEAVAQKDPAWSPANYYGGPGMPLRYVSDQDLANAQNAGTIGWNQVLDPQSGKMVYTSTGGPQPPSKAEWDAGAAERGVAAKAPPTYWETLAQQQQAATPAAPTSTAFDPLKFLSSLQAGERAQIQSGQDTLTFVPYKPDQAAQYAAPDGGYEQIGEGFYAKSSGQGAGAEIYLPQDRASDIGKALAGYTGSPVAAQVGALLAPSGQEAGATPGAGPAGDIAPEAVAAGTSSTEQPTGAIAPPPDATQPLPGAGFKAGGAVPKTGQYMLHKGELIIPANQADSILDPAKEMEDEGRLEETLQDMRKKGQLNLGGPSPLEMPKPGPSWRSPDPTMPDEAAAPNEKGWYVHIKEGVPSQDLDGNDPMVRRLAFTPDEVEQALDAGEAPIMVGKGVLTLPPSAIRGFLQNAQNMQNKDPMKHPAMVAMGNRIRQAQSMKPEGDPLPYPGLGAKILRGPQPRFKGDRGRGADRPLDAVGGWPTEIGGGLSGAEDSFRNMDVLPKADPPMPSIPDAVPPPNQFQVRGLGGPGIGRAMRLAQGPAEDFARQDRMLEGIDRGTIAPSTLGGASREQRQNLTPEDIMRRPSRPAGAPQPQPGLLEQFRRRVTG